MQGITITIKTSNQIRRLCTVENENLPIAGSLGTGLQDPRQPRVKRSVKIIDHHSSGREETHLPRSRDQSYGRHIHDLRQQSLTTFQKDRESVESDSYGYRSDKARLSGGDYHHSQGESAYSSSRDDSLTSPRIDYNLIEERDKSRDNRLTLPQMDYHSSEGMNSYRSHENRISQMDYHSSEEMDSYRSCDNRRTLSKMEYHSSVEMDTYRSRDERQLSQTHRHSRVSRDERQLSHPKRHSHASRDDRPQSHPERHSHVSRNKGQLSHPERHSLVSSDERKLSHPKRHSNVSRDLSHVSRDERPKSHPERHSRVSSDARKLSQPKRHSNVSRDLSHVSRDERPQSHTERHSHVSRDERPQPHPERHSHVSRDEIPHSHRKRHSYVSRDERPQSHPERHSHVSRDARSKSHAEGDVHVSLDAKGTTARDENSYPLSRDEELISFHEKDSYISREDRHISSAEGSFILEESVSHGVKKVQPCPRRSEAGDSKTGRLKSSCPCDKHVSHDLTQSLNQTRQEVSNMMEETVPDIRSNPRARKRKRSDSLEDNESVQVKKKKRVFNPIGYKSLETICQKEDKNEAMLEIIKMEGRYTALLNSDEAIREDLFKLVIDSLIIVIESTNRKTHAYEILQTTHARLLQAHFPTFIFDCLPSMKSSTEDSELNELFSKIISIFEALLQRFSENRTVFNGVRMIMLKLSNEVGEVNQQDRTNDVITHRIEQVNILLNDIKNQLDRISSGDNRNESPPDDFRKMSVIPTEADFKPGFRPFLRANVINNAYESTEHYLDVQFRLLREDFIMPLREGIKELRLKRNKNKRAHGREEEDNRPRQNTFLYEDIRIINPVCHRNGGVYRLQINLQVGRLKRVNWRKFMLKRLKFGALVCLSPDNFTSLLFATIENRDWCDLKCGLLDLRFENCDAERMQDAIESKCVFQMIESEAYFEAYRHNLIALQTMNEEKLFFKDCIVFCKNMQLPPKYLTEIVVNPQGNDSKQLDEYEMESDQSWHASEESSEDSSLFESEEDSESGMSSIAADPEFLQGWYDSEESSEDSSLMFESDEDSETDERKFMDMTSIADPDILQDLNLDLSRVPVLNVQQWPSKEALGFDESQYRACQLALTKRFALIQGPPGTGKTYVGLKIAQVLLDNPDLWSGERRSPILMVSYTNHALDQFLMGLKNKEGVVRVGGRSKEEKLKEFMIRELRTKRRKNGRVDSNSRERGRVWKERKIIEENFAPNKANTLIAEGYKGVLSFGKLKDVVKPNHLRCFTSDDKTISEDAQLLQWLQIKPKHREQSQDGARHQMLQSEDFRKVVSFREFEDEEEDNDDDFGAETEGPAVSCYVNDAENSEELFNNLQSHETMSKENEESIKDVFRLYSHERWNLYRLWRFQLEQIYQERIRASQAEGYETLLMKLSEINADEDLDILSEAKVIAMTTTCAAKYRELLQQVCPKIVLVEEAAEVLEAHILTSLPLDCEHVILIGDHQQLRPSCTVYELAKKYKLNISMFERLVKLKMPCEKLTVQHRMRPEIAALMRHIYKGLKNHESVHEYDDVLGFQHNMFFIDHSHSEGDSEDSFSHFNEHEAQFVVKLCRYIIQQGYRPSQITILTPYLGQMFTIRDHLMSEVEIRLTTIDNYQGEENDIILLSLVRSNDLGHVGFVNDINRACVALSRARMGLYVIGNFKLLSEKSEIWKKVVGDVKKTGKLGKALPLCCQRHKRKILVKEPEDFQEKVPCGGCRSDCQYRLDCGHSCTLPCHPYDQEHKNVRCTKPCTIVIHGCTKGHICRNLCGQECEPRCLYPVDKTLPCNHVKKNARCSDNPFDIRCDERCQNRLACGHKCQARCGEPCTTACQELVKRNNWSCGHKVTIACSATPLDCPGPCGLLSCGHQCSGHCGECLQGRVHRRCKKKCGKILFCGHECVANCTDACPPCSRNCETKCKHSKCGRKCGEPCTPCVEPCEWKCKHLKCRKRCGEICDRPRCNEPCRKVLQCKHQCRGLCNETCICVKCERSNIKTIVVPEEIDDKTARFIQLNDCKHIFVVSVLDRCLDTEVDTDKSAIQPKVCPWCKTPIRMTMRYNNVIKEHLKDIERVKAKILNETQPLAQERKANITCKLNEYLRDAASSSSGQKHGKDCDVLFKRISQAKYFFQIASTENQIELLKRCHKLSNKATAIQARIAENLEKAREIQEISQSILILNLLKKKRVIGSVGREITDIELELRRHKVIIEVCSLLAETEIRHIWLANDHKTILYSIRNTLSQSNKAEPELNSYLTRIEEIRSKYPIDPPTREEKDQIIKATGLSKGHWYKCRQGHLFAVGECGVAMETGTCPECKGVIGRASQRL